MIFILFLTIFHDIRLWYVLNDVVTEKSIDLVNFRWIYVGSGIFVDHDDVYRFSEGGGHI